MSVLLGFNFGCKSPERLNLRSGWFSCRLYIQNNQALVIDNIFTLANGHKPESIYLLHSLSQWLDPAILARAEQLSGVRASDHKQGQRTLKAAYMHEVSYRKTSKKLVVLILIHASWQKQSSRVNRVNRVSRDRRALYHDPTLTTHAQGCLYA